MGMADWLAVYLFQLPVTLEYITVFQWHAHEMIFGYGTAVIAGFLLTAAWNWTGFKTADGAWLLVLFGLWATARVLMLRGTELATVASAADLAFLLGLLVTIARPVVLAGQLRRQAPVLTLLTALVAANTLFYLGATGRMASGATLGVYAGLYVELGMVLFLGRRVIPFFTARGVGYEVRMRTERWVDAAMFSVYPPFVLVELLFPGHIAGALLAGALLYLNSRRVMGWHTLGIWQKPLLWGLFASFILVNLGFLLRALMHVTAVPAFLPIHAFALGGIGLITVSMMARVTLGHTGRDVHKPPLLVTPMLGCMMAATVIRIFLPLADPSHYGLWSGIAGVLWIICFLLFTIAFAPMLLRKRIDADN